MIVKINHKFFMIFSMFIILLEANYWALSSYVVTLRFRLVIWFLAAMIPFLLPLRNIKRNLAVVPWIIYLLLVLLNRNQELKNGEFFFTFRIALCLIFIYAGIKSLEWITWAPKMIIGIGFANVIATLLFFANNSLYELFISMTYKEYQHGTDNGLYGYRAALADHYSQNGTYVAIVMLVIWGLFLSSPNRDKNRKKLLILGTIATLALLLTNKRAHLLFGAAAIIITYYAVNQAKRIERTFKLMMAGTVVLIALNFLMDYIPQISDVFNRFQTAGTDEASMYRLIMWQRAIQLFNQHTFLGIGWYGFKYNSGLSPLIGASAGCHNIYLEVLCENGIIGFVVCLCAMGSSLFITYKNLNIVHNQNTLQREKKALAVSFVIQIFVILYGLTGNPLFDTTFYFYAIAVAMNLAFTVNFKRKIHV